MTSGRRFPLVPAVLGGLLGVGLSCFARQMVEGDAVTGLAAIGGGGAVWGLYVAMDGFLLGAGVAIMIGACVARLVRDREMEAVAHIAIPVALACFLGAGLSVMADQGRPWLALRNLALYARPSSPLFATATSVGGIGLYGSLVYYLLARRPDLAESAMPPSPSVWRRLRRILRAGYSGSASQRYRRKKVGFWMSILLLPTLCVPLFALAEIFTSRPGRPPALLVMEIVSFVLLALTSGLGLVIVAAAAAKRWSGFVAPPGSGVFAGSGVFDQLGRLLMLLVSISLVTLVATGIFSVGSGEPASASYADALVRGSYAWAFWSAIAILFLVVGSLWGAARRSSLEPRQVVVASVLVELAVAVQRYLLLVAWQTHGLSLPYRPGSYRPTFVELGVQLGILAFGGLVLLLLVRLFPLAQPAPPAINEEPPRKPPRDLRRTWLTLGFALVGLAVSGAGLLLSGRAFTESFLDPAFPGSPALLVVGLMLLVTTGAIYELLPDRPDKR